MPNEIEIVIKTKAELSAAKQTADSLEKSIANAKILGKDYSEMESKLGKARKAISAFEAAQPKQGIIGHFKALNEELTGIFPKLGQFEGFLGKLAMGPVGIAAAGIGLLAGAVTAAGKALSEFSGKQDAIAKLDAALARSGQLTDEYRARLQELSNQMEDSTGVADDDWLGVLTRLTQFGADQSNIERYTQAVANLAGLMDGDVKAAGEAFAKAFNGQYEAFSRYGIKVEEAGTQTEKLDKLMQQLASRGGGQLTALNQTLSGQWRQLKNATGDIVESFGQWIASFGLVQKSMELVTVALKFWGDMISSTVPKLDGLKNAQDKTIESSAEAAEKEKAHSAQLKAVATSAKEAEEWLNKYNVEVDRAKSDEQKVDDSKRDYELALIRKQETTGRISTVQAAFARAGVEEKYATRAFNREQEAKQQKMEAAQTVVDQFWQERQGKESDIETSRKRVAAAKEVASVEAKYRRMLSVDGGTPNYWDTERLVKMRQQASGGFTDLKSLTEEESNLKKSIERNDEFRKEYGPIAGRAREQVETASRDIGQSAKVFGYQTKTRRVGAEIDVYQAVNAEADKMAESMKRGERNVLQKQQQATQMSEAVMGRVAQSLDIMIARMNAFGSRMDKIERQQSGFRY